MTVTHAAWIASVVALVAAPTFSAADAQQQRGQEQRGQAAQQQRRASPRDERASLEDRVFARLAERAYAGADFTIDDRGQGVVAIKGTVPSEDQRERVLRIVRRTPEVREVRDELRVDPSVAREQAAQQRVDDNELERRVAQAIAQAVPGAKAGESWWFRGWRVEGPDNAWNFDVDVDRGDVTLDGDVPRHDIVRGAVEAALDVPGVRSVRSELETERFMGYRRLPYGGYPPAARTGPGVARPGPRGAAVHAVQGDVTRVDREQGTLTLQTAQGQVTLPFPPATLRTVSQGDRVTVQLGLWEAPPAASPRTGPGARDGDGQPTR